MYKYKGGGFIPGVPARDLDQDDVDGLDKEQLKAVEASGLYEKVSQKPKPSADKLAKGSEENKN